ncbi:MAG: hypothetical protein JST10_14910 [Bacteroidetes bacterium]|nr:hypothetical protein [Bacteroidota bacterium]
MLHLNPNLLLTPEFIENELFVSPLNGTTARGVYNPMQFVLRLRNDVRHELDSIKAGLINSGEITFDQAQAHSTYIHETIHWWQHVGSNYGLISSLKFPAQSHIAHSDLLTILKDIGAIKSIDKYNKTYPYNVNITKALNYWYDIEFAGQIAFDPKRMKRITQSPYFESWGHSYNIKWSSTIWTLASIVDKDLTFLPNIKKWETGFKTLTDKKIKGFYYGSQNSIMPIGTKAIFEGQARISQIQLLFNSSHGKMCMSDFAKIGMLNGIYSEALQLFLDILSEPMPNNANDPLVGLFLLLCDIAMNPTDGFPFDISHYESFIISNDPGYRFCLICQMIRDKHPALKHSIQNYSKEEYINISEALTRSIGCFSPFESAAYICDWIQTENSLKQLLSEEKNYKYSKINLPIRLFFSKFLRFQEDKVKCPQFFCWPGIHFSENEKNSLQLMDCLTLFEKHKALFIDDVNGDIHHAAIDNCSVEQLDETLNEFYSWNCMYDMTRQWIIKDGPFNFDYGWLSSKYTNTDMENWASTHFEKTFGVKPGDFKII